MPITRIHWTLDEIKACAELTARLQLKSGLNFEKAFDRAQRETLESHRWRTGPVKGVSSAGKIFEKIYLASKIELTRHYAPDPAKEADLLPVHPDLLAVAHLNTPELVAPRIKAGLESLALPYQPGILIKKMPASISAEIANLVSDFTTKLAELISAELTAKLTPIVAAPAKPTPNKGVVYLMVPEWMMPHIKTGPGVAKIMEEKLTLRWGCPIKALGDHGDFLAVIVLTNFTPTIIKDRIVKDYDQKVILMMGAATDIIGKLHDLASAI